MVCQADGWSGTIAAEWEQGRWTGCHLGWMCTYIFFLKEREMLILFQYEIQELNGKTQEKK